MRNSRAGDTFLWCVGLRGSQNLGVATYVSVRFASKYIWSKYIYGIRVNLKVSNNPGSCCFKYINSKKKEKKKYINFSCHFGFLLISCWEWSGSSIKT